MNQITRRHRAARFASAFAVAVALGLSMQLVDVSAQSGQLPVPLPGRNVNMVSGKNHPDGDPFLQRQNEPSIAVSTRNPEHLLGAANDYRTVDIPGLGEEVNGDAWIGVFKSFDGGKTFKSTLLPGYRQDATTIGKQSPLYGLEAGADPVVRAGTNGLFYLAGMAFNRDQDAGRIFLSRYIDNNNLEAGDSIAYIGTTVVDIGNTNRFLDKPWMTVDIPRAMKGEARTDAKDKADKNAHNGVPKKATSGAVCTVPGQAQPIPAGNIYIVYSVFLDNDSGDQKKDANGKTSFERELDRLEREEGKEKDEHKPGQPVDGRTKIMLTRSTDCGATFDAPKQISDRTQINQGATLAIDPATGTVYVAWREFLSSKQPDAILVAKSTDFGHTFSTPVVLRTITPFDQGTTSTSFRTNSYPTMAVDGVGRVYVAWAQRGAGMSGDARIVISSSTDGKTWSDPAPADNPPQRGHQFMPVLTFGGGRLHLVFWDQRDDMSKMWGYFIDEAPILNYVGPKETRPTRHTLDLRAVSAWPGAPPQWGPSAKVSNYLEGIMPGKTKAEQLQFNAPNLPLFSLGTKPFIGDYLDVTVSPTFIANGDGTWRFNTLSSDPAQYFTAWGDNRDVRPPKDGNWVHYTPPTFAGYTGTSIYDPTQPVEMCKPGQAGMRDQNVYSAKVSSGLIVTTPGNNKRLGFVTDANGVKRLMDRTFVITVANPDAKLVKSVVLHITSQPPGGRASFLQFSQLIDLPVDIAPESSISREVFVTSTDPAATVPLTVTEGSSPDVSARLYLNPDPTNPDIDNPDIDNGGIQNPDIDNAEAHNITVSTPDIDNPDIDNVSTLNPDIDNPDIDNPDIDNTRLINKAILNPDIDNPDIDNPDIDNTNILNPDIDNPDIDNPDIDNGALTDVMWNVANIGNTATSYQVKLLLKQAQQQRLLNAGVKFQLLVTKTTAAPTIDKCAVVEPNRNLTVVKINSPSFVDPTNEQQRASILTPDIDNPDIDNATVALAPGDNARVTLRIFSPVGDTTPTEGSGGGDPLEDLTGALEDLQHVGVATTSHPVDTLAVIAGETTPHVEASIPLITTATLRDATRGSIYTDTIEQSGSAAPFAFTITGGGLPQGLTLNADGTITGTPAVSGSFTFSVKVTDAQDNYATATLTLRVFEPIIVAGATLASAGINQPYAAPVSASGGFPPYAWTVVGGALPAGLSLTPAGVVTGTPTQSGTFNFVAMAMDSAFPPKSAVGAFVLKVAAAANPQNVNVVEDTATPITVTGTGTGPFTFNVGNTPAHGNLNGNGPFTYTPDLNYTGPDNFTFTATQGDLTSAPATVSINVTAVNDAPSATPKTVNTPQGVAIPIVLTGTDPENNPLTFSIAANPTTGTLSGVAPNVTYNPPLNGFTGTATFTFRANDGSLNSAPATVTVIVGPPPANSADVTLTLADAPDPVALGGSITYTATLHNNGPAAATGVALSLTYPFADLLVQSVVPSQGSCASANAITCTIGTIANGGNATVTVTMKAFNRGGAFTVSGSSTGTLLDYNTTNNTAAAITTVTGPATATTDLRVTQSRQPDPVAFGSNVVYTIVVTNIGPSDATGVTLSNAFTSNTAQFVSFQGGCATNGNQVTCSVDELPGGASKSYIVTLKAIGAGTISNTATVTGTQLDPDATNNTQTLTTTVQNRQPTAVNDAVTTREDLAATFAVVANDTDPDNDNLSLIIVDQPGHGFTQISGNAVQYTPVPNYFGSDTFTYQISDGHGGLASGTVNVSVLAVNDAPSFVKGPNQFAAENSGAHTVPGWATAINVGPANEAGQTINFVVSNNNHFFFSAQPEVSPNGTLTYTAAPSGTGSARVTVTAVDSGGTDNGGIDSSTSQTFTISISTTNDAPSFTMGADQMVAQNAAPQLVPNWATNISAGPPDEAGQALDFIVSTNEGGLFAQLPSISPNGTLTYQPAAGHAGIATVTVRLHDNGGGEDTSPANTFLISIDATGPATYAVFNTNDSGSGSLRAAITAANASQFDDTIRFAIPGAGPFTIQPITGLPSITSPVNLDAMTQPGFNGIPIIEIDGTNAGAVSGLHVLTNNTTIRGFVINRFALNGIDIGGDHNLVAGNYVGVNAAGDAPRGNGRHGVLIFGAPNTVGGATAADRNVVSGNAQDGIIVQNTGAAGNAIKGNYVGTNAAGTAAIGNERWGVNLEQSNSTTVGGDAAGEGNLISGNLGYGLHVNYCAPPNPIINCQGHTIAGNKIGTDVTGMFAIKNLLDGVHVTYAPNNNIRGNVISGNGDPAMGSFGFGISIQGARVTDDPDAELHYGHQTITNNLIGVAADGVTAMPNSYMGIHLSGMVKATIGGGPLAGNTIAYNALGGVMLGSNSGDDTDNTVVSYNRVFNNGAAGVAVPYGRNNVIARNEIHDNAGLGIDIDLPGVTANDPSDSDDGANAKQNFPVLTGAQTINGNTTVIGSLNSTPNTTFAIEYFSSAAADPSGYGEGEVFLGTALVTTNNLGVINFIQPVMTQAVGRKITVTATDPDGNTSEFSPAVTVTNNTAPTATDDNLTAVSGQPTTLDVLANDTDANNDTLTVISATAPAHGTATIAPGGGSIIYTSTVGYTGSDAFTYTISDGHGASSTATVNVLVSFTMCAAPTFAGPRNFAVDGAIDLGDFDRDGHLDVVGSRNGVFEIAFGLGDGGFGATTPVGNGSSPRVGDFNHDGNPDVVVRDANGNVSLWIGNGTGALLAQGSFPVQSLGPIAPVDLNHDGNLDLIVSNGNSSQPSATVLLNIGAGVFGAPTTFDIPGHPNFASVVGDFNGDGHTDLAIPLTAPPRIAIATGDGTGAFTQTASIDLPAEVGPFVIQAAGDVNGDHTTDISVVWNPLPPPPTGINQNLSLLISNGAGGFAQLANLVSGSPLTGTGALAQGDFNGDGDLDLAATSSGVGANGAILVFLGDGIGTFAAPTILPVGIPAQALAADLNGDGRSDILGDRVGSGNSMYVLLNSCGTTSHTDLEVVTNPLTNATSGDNVTYTVDVANHGPDVATGIVFTVAPQFVSSNGGFDLLTVTTQTGACPVLGATSLQYATCTLPNLAVGETTTVTISARVLGARTVTNMVMATAAQGDTNPADNVATLSTIVAAHNLTFGVANTNDSGPGSLRQAITDSNANIGATNAINFNIAGPGPYTISPLSRLPNISVPVLLDGTTQPGFVSAPIIEINGILAGVVDGISISGNNSTVRGLIINGFNAPGASALFVTGNGNVITGNYLGTDRTGTFAAPNSHGVTITRSTNVVGPGNVISGNTNNGVALFNTGGASSNVIKGNYIGTDASGTAALGNNVGVMIASSSNNTVGGVLAGAGNVISGNRFDGIDLNSTSGNVVVGNVIGANKFGTAPLANAGVGIGISAGSGNTIGGTSVAAQNIIGANSNGISLYGGTHHNTIQGNRIGVTASGASLRNVFHGIDILGANDNIIGGIAPGEGNVMQFDAYGVWAENGTGNSIRGNQMFNHTNLGINLVPGGVTANDPGDADIGPNNLQNYPDLSQASAEVASTKVTGVLDSTPNSVFFVDFYANTATAPSGFGEGELYLGSITVNTDGAGLAPFTATLPLVAVGQFITSTATDAAGNTSEFSHAIVVVNANTAPTANDDAATAASGQPITINVLGNDSDADDDTLTVIDVTQPNHGTATIAAGGASVSYTSAAGYAGPDSFTYTVSDGHGGTSTATVAVLVTTTRDLLVSSMDNAIRRYDGATGAFKGTFIAAASGGLNGPTGFVFGPDGNFYVSSIYTGSIKRYDGATGAYLGDFVPTGAGGGIEPYEITFGPDGNLYVANGGDFGDAGVKRFNGTTGAFIDEFIPNLGNTSGVTFGPDGNVYVTDAGAVRRYSASTGALIDTIAPTDNAGNPAFARFGPDGYLYVNYFYGHRIQRFNTVTGADLGTFVPEGSGGLFWVASLGFGPDGNLYTTERYSNAVFRFDGTTGAPLGTFASGIPGEVFHLDWFPAVPATTVDLSVTIADSQDPVVPGAAYSYEVAIHNDGPAVASGVGFRINTSANVTIQAINGPGTCGLTGANEFTCDPSSIASDATAIYTVEMLAVSAGTATATVSLTSSSTDRNITNNSATESTVLNNPPEGTTDHLLTTEGFAITSNPGANDTDPDVASPQIRTVYQPFGGGPMLTAPGEVVVVPGAGRAYFSGGNQNVFTSGKFGVLDLATNAISAVVNGTGLTGSTMSAVTSSQIVYMRTAGTSALTAIDARSNSATFNKQIVSLFLGNIQYLALDDLHHRLYLSVFSNGSARIVILDTDTTSGTFNQVIAEVASPTPNTNVQAMAVNSAANKIYFTQTGTTGLYVLDGGTLSVKNVFTGFAPAMLAFNDVDNMVYAISNNSFIVVDATTDTPLLPLTNLVVGAGAGQFNTRMVVHRARGRVYVRTSEYPNVSRLLVIDGRRNSTTIGQILTTLSIGHEIGQTTMAIDETHDRLVTTSAADLKTTVVNTATNTIVGLPVPTGSPVPSNQPSVRVTIDTQLQRAYVAGAIGYIQVIDLTNSTQVALVPVGVELFSVVPDPVTHAAYITSTAVDANVVRLLANGAHGNLSVPHAKGREIYAIRNNVTGKLYVLNSASNLAGDGDALPGFLQIFDSATNALEASVGVGQLPFGLAIDDDVTRNKVYVGNTTNGAQIIGGISIVDENNNHVVTQANLSAIPLAAGSPGLSIARDMVVNRTTGRLYFRITGGSATQAGVLNGSTGTALPIAGNVNIIKADPVLNRIYIGATPLNGGNNQIHVLNGDTDQEIATLTTGEVSPFIANHSYFATNHNTGELFAVDFDSSNLSIFNSNHVQVGSIPMPFGPQTVAVNETLNRIYVGSMFEKVLTIVDGATRRVVRSMTLPITPARIELDTAASPARLYVQSLPLEASVVVIDDPNTPAPRVTSVTQAEHGTVALNGDGSVTYAPTDGFIGVDSYSYTTTDGHGGTTTATAMINVIANFDIVEHQLPNPVLNVPYSQTLHTEGGEGVKTWTMSGSLPAGMRFDGTTGTISGVPRQAGQFFVTISARDSGSIVQLDDDENYSLNVDGGPLTMADLREGVILETQPSIQFIGGNGTINATLAAGSSLPAGLTLNANGSFSGSPRHHGTFDFTIELRDCLGGSCGSNFNQQVVSKNITWRVSAKDQQSGSQTQPAISFGGPNGRRLAQVVTIGSQGGLNGIGLQNITCPTVGTMVSVDIQRLNASGVPDGHSVASGTATANFNAIATAPSIGFAIDERFAFVINATAPCNITNAPITDVYNGGDAYADAGAGWQPLLNAPDLRYDIPSFRTLITPAIDVQYMTTAQGGNTATRLTSGRILVAGNSNGTAAHLFDENTGTFTQVTGALSASRQNATATVLGNGQVLLTGGRDQNGNRLITAEIYDPGTNTFIPTGNMNFARENHRAVWFVANGVGRVLITGGVTIGGGTIANAELYNPLTQTFTPISNMLLARQQHTVTLLDNNTILIAAGYGSGSGPSAEIYDPSTGVFTATANSMVVTNRGVATATKLNDGTVLIAGGQSNDVRAEAEIYDPILNTFSATSSMLSKRYLHTATLLNDGSVLVAGGFDQQNISNYTLALATTERYVPDTNNPGTGTWVAAAGLETRRQAHAAALLPSGKVLIVGSFSQSYMGGNTGELVDPAGTPTFTPATLANATPGNFYSVTFTGSGGSGGPYEITQESGQLPAGLTYDPLTQTLSGVPTTGLYTFAMRVTDSAHHANVRTLTLRAGSVLTITNAYRLLDAGQNEQYNVPLTATGGVGALVWSLLPAVNNPLPAGITLSSDGVLSGSPATLGFFNFGVRVVDKVDNVIVADTYKMLAISVQSPLTITTAALSNPLLFQNIPGCLSSSGGTGTRTWSLFAGALPPGISINSSNGCFTGTSGALGTFNFTVKVTDQSSVPQADTKAFSVTITALNDQGSSSDSTQSAIGFGGNGGNRIAERVITGVTGVLSAVRVTGSSICPAGTNVTAEVQGVALNGGPDGTVLASGTAVYPSDITLNTNLFFTADQTFTIVFSADTGCGVRPSTFDSYPGEGYVFDTEWKRLKDVDASHRFDIPFQTIVTPSPGLGFMKFSRSNHTAIALNNGKILLVSDLTSELYDPATNTFTQTGNMTVQRFKPAATLLVDGRVLVTGGYNFSGVNGALVYLSSAEIFDPLDNTFSATSAMSTARAYHTATKLDDGTVLIAGGENFINNVFNRLRSTEIYTPGHGFSAGPDMAGARSIHTASLLGDGRVLILGGSGTFSSLQAAEIYTPGDPGSFANTINQPTVPFRNNHTATTLSNGLVLIAGGGGSLAGSNAELFDYHDETFSFAGTLLQPRTLHTATLLNDGTVLFSGGLDDSRCCGPYPAKPQLERFEYGVGFSNAGNMLVSRYFHAAALIPGSDRVLFTGSSGWSSAAGRLSEIYDPATVVALKDVNAPQGSVGNEYQSFTLDAIGGTAPYSITFLSGKLPDGLHYDAGNKVIYGTPSASGTFVATFKVQDSAGHSSTQTITIRVDALTITTTSLPIATVNRGYEAMLSSEGGTGTIKWSIYSGSLPAGIHLQESGLIDGTPAQTGFSGFTARAADDNGQIALRSFSFNVFSPMTITNSSLADGMAGETYFDCLNTINGNYPITWSVTGVPGLQFFEGSGCFDNTYPQRIMHQGGVFTATITATDSSAPVAQEDTRNFTLRLHAQDQGLGGGSTPDVALPSSRRAAQVLRAGTAYPSSGVQLWNISACTANTTITATLRPVTGMPERPDETGAPLAQATVTTDMNGYFNSRLAWPAPVAMPKGSLFAIVISFANGSCQGTFWPADEFYEFGQGWISDNGGVWKRSATEIGRADVPISTLVMPAADLLFTDTWRTQHVTATLDDGRILIAGGSDATAEIYDPATHTITATPGSMSTVRWNATATTLDDHNVLIVGGSHYNVDTQMTEAVSSADLFDPSTGLFSAAASLPGGRYNHTATKLDNDKVLIAGGLVAAPGGFFEGVGTAVLYSADGHSTTVLTMTGARYEHSATTLADGRVLIAGGWGGSPFPYSAEIFDPSDNSFTATSHEMPRFQPSHTATLLASGKVLIAGGLTGSYPDLSGDTQFYDPETDAFTNGPPMVTPRYDHAAIALGDGRVLLFGGGLKWSNWMPTAAVEIYDPVQNEFREIPDMVVDRYAPSVDLIASGPYLGQALLVGGQSTSNVAGRTVEHYQPNTSTLVIREQVLPTASLNVNYAVSLAVYGDTSGAVTFSLERGSLPSGLTLNGTGTITGSPSQASFHTFVVRAQDAASHVAYRTFSIRVDPLIITTNVLPPGVINQPYSQQIEHSGGVGDVVWSITSNNLPVGFTFSPSGLLSGQSATPVNMWVTVRAIDETGYAVYQTLLIEIVDP